MVCISTHDLPAGAWEFDDRGVDGFWTNEPPKRRYNRKEVLPYETQPVERVSFGSTITERNK